MRLAASRGGQTGRFLFARRKIRSIDGFGTQEFAHAALSLSSIRPFDGLTR